VSKQRVWRAPTLEDRKRKCRARSRFEKNPFYVVWNKQYKTWCLANSPHILVAVHEILSAKEVKS
jgi:hypothetical protein